MQYKKIIFAITLAGLSCPLSAQTISRWHRLPRHGQPLIIRHPLEGSAQPGDLLRFRFESRPVTPMMRLIKHGFTELYPEAAPDENIIDISRSTILLEELENEANAALNHGYENLNLSQESDFSIFDQPVATETAEATDSLLLPDLPPLPQATISLTLTGN